MASNEELKQILRELRSGGDVARIKEKAAESLKKVDPKTLSLAEQELMQEGISQEELRRLCDVHLEVISQGLAREKLEVFGVLERCVRLEQESYGL
ncbi:MAG: DUF438 domain-containing protein [Dehalococcoidia bacterium]|nr:MAG: DUF438 domain-containing protein [Dehalococcoidia bacterium]